MWWEGSRSRCARCRFYPRTTDSPRSHWLQNKTQHKALGLATLQGRWSKKVKEQKGAERERRRKQQVRQSSFSSYDLSFTDVLLSLFYDTFSRWFTALFCLQDKINKYVEHVEALLSLHLSSSRPNTVMMHYSMLPCGWGCKLIRARVSYPGDLKV